MALKRDFPTAVNERKREGDVRHMDHNHKYWATALVVRLGFVGICNKEDRWRDERVQGCKGVKLNFGIQD